MHCLALPSFWISKKSWRLNPRVYMIGCLFLKIIFSTNWNNSTLYIYQFLYFFPTVRSLFQTVCLLDFGIDFQLAYFWHEKCLDMLQNRFRHQFIVKCIIFFQKFAHQHDYYRLYVYSFVWIFPPVRLFQTFRLFQSLEYLKISIIVEKTF